MTLLDRLEDLLGCTVVLVDRDEATVVLWSGEKAFLRYQVHPDGRLSEAGSWFAKARPESLERARALAAIATYR
jgi:hypothetical protein